VSDTRRTAVHRIEVLVIDHDELGAEEVGTTIEEARYPNRCIHPRALSSETRWVDWSDEHPLNQPDWEAAYRELFGVRS